MDAPGVGGAHAALLGLVQTSAEDLRTEIAPVMTLMTLRAYQRTHVTTNAFGLLRPFNLPSDPEAPGLSLRRMVWTASPGNQASAQTAERIGFTREGVLRWVSVLTEGREGREPHVCAPLGRFGEWRQRYREANNGWLPGEGTARTRRVTSNSNSTLRS